MIILFLDHYGVMVTSPVNVIRSKNDFPSVEELRLTKPLDPFNRMCVSNLNEIISISNCEIVLTSDWTKSISFGRICEFYLSQGIIKSPIGYIENGKDVRKSRSDGISKWVDENDVQKWACVDDIYLDIENFVWCRNPSLGITDLIRIEITDLLN